MILIKKISAKDTYAIRLEVLRKKIDLPFEFDGDFNEDTFHLGAYVDNNLVGVSSYMKNTNRLFEGKQYQLRGMATLPIVRGKGCGRLMLTYALEELGKRNVEVLWFNARTIALRFYTKMGFLITGEPFKLPKVGEHYTMYKKI